MLEGCGGISAPAADKFARYRVVLEHYGIVALEFNAVAVVTIVCAVVRALYGERVPAAVDGAVLESGEFLRGESVEHLVLLTVAVAPLAQPVDIHYSYLVFGVNKISEEFFLHRIFTNGYRENSCRQLSLSYKKG